ncbi:PKD domain-containing protein [Candidatus Entotheonella palauensis]|uniref:PKD domain-containing protein n=1 Tax=Candidatus Entotheonella palauensis TaxID=93172 RepID=UPI000B7D1F6F|nr:PKD domain-containing protein [Candidatus Entotheonella palauensis]
MTRLGSVTCGLLWLWIGWALIGGLPAGQSLGQSRSEGIDALEDIAAHGKAWQADKISSLLLQTRARIERQGTLPAPWIPVGADHRLRAYLEVYRFGTAERTELRTHGADIEWVGRTDDVVQARIPLAELEAIAALPFVQRLTPPHYGTIPHRGAITAARGRVTTEGDVLLFAHALRELGFDGTGTRVAVIADGANNRADAIATGDLPPDLAVFGTCTPTAMTTCNLGTAMLEIIHDLAPGAELAIGALDFSQGVTTFDLMRRIDEVVETFGADIVMHLPRFFQEPYFEDGRLAQHVAQHVANDVLYTLGAGDEAQHHYEADFTRALVNDLQIHDFGAAAGEASDLTMDVRIEPGETLTAWLQWDDPFGGAGNDYDLFIIDETETITFASGSDTQDGDDHPREVAMFTNETADASTVKLMVRKFDGEARRLEIFVLGGIRIEEYGMPGGSIFGPAAVPGVVTVGAVAASAPDTIEPFSSRGPGRIAAPRREVRLKPDLSAVDRVMVTGSDGPASHFAGTSVAAAHVAGIAALLRQALPTATATDIREAMMAGAVDLGASGPDTTFGAGLIHALNAFRFNMNEPPNGVIETPEQEVTIEVGERIRFTSRGTDRDGPFPLRFAWDFGGGAPDSTREDPGHVRFDTPGVFTVTLTVTDGLGLPDPTPATRQITVNMPPAPPPSPPAPPPSPPEPPRNEPPNGVIDTPDRDVVIEVGESVHFTASGSDPDGPLSLSFRWDFGGGASNVIEEDPGDVRGSIR